MSPRIKEIQKILEYLLSSSQNKISIIRKSSTKKLSPEDKLLVKDLDALLDITRLFVNRAFIVSIFTKKSGSDEKQDISSSSGYSLVWAKIKPAMDSLELSLSLENDEKITAHIKRIQQPDNVIKLSPVFGSTIMNGKIVGTFSDLLIEYIQHIHGEIRFLESQKQINLMGLLTLLLLAHAYVSGHLNFPYFLTIIENITKNIFNKLLDLSTHPKFETLDKDLKIRDLIVFLNVLSSYINKVKDTAGSISSINFASTRIFGGLEAQQLWKEYIKFDPVLEGIAHICYVLENPYYSEKIRYMFVIAWLVPLDRLLEKFYPSELIQDLDDSAKNSLKQYEFIVFLGFTINEPIQHIFQVEQLKKYLSRLPERIMVALSHLIGFSTSTNREASTIEDKEISGSGSRDNTRSSKFLIFDLDRAELVLSFVDVEKQVAGFKLR